MAEPLFENVSKGNYTLGDAINFDKVKSIPIK